MFLNYNIELLTLMKAMFKIELVVLIPENYLIFSLMLLFKIIKTKIMD